jgi:membrane-associated protease RseP (regulator of RpoE activity)
MIVMLGGPSMNLLIYLVLTVVIFTTLGKYHEDATTTVGDVTQCVVPANSPEAGRDTCPAGATDVQTAPAFGKLQPGDKILAVNSTAISSWDQLVGFIEPSAGKSLTLTIDRHGVTQQVRVTPVENLKYAADGKTLKHAGFLGIGSRLHKYFQPLGISGVPREVGSQLRQGVDALASYPHKIAGLWDTVVHGKQRDPNGAIGVVGIGRLGGEFASTHALDVQQKVFTLVELLATVNLLLFFFNLLPLLPLDGGHVAGALVEAAKRGRARLAARRSGERARPQIFVDTAQMLPVMYAVASVLIVLTLLTLYADIVKPIRLNG